jgi:hypothetical protein
VIAFLLKHWRVLIMVALGIYIAVLRHDLGNARHTIALDTQFRNDVRNELHVKSEDRLTILSFLQAAMQTSENRKQALERISREALEANQRSTAADASLKREQEANARKFAAAQAKINDLMTRRPTGNADEDCALIEEDSKAPWKGWK